MTLLNHKLNQTAIIQLLLIAMFTNIVILRLVDTGPILGSDSYVYLNTAINFTQAEIARTDIIYFDTERSHGTASAPLTTFPSGYSLLISWLVQIGVPADWAGASISLAGILLCIYFVYQICLRLQLSTLAQVTATVILASNNLVIEYASTVLTEPLFTVLVTAALFYLIKAISEKGFTYEKFGYLLLCHLLLGLSFWVRYAGIFFFLAFAIIHLAIFIIYRNKQNFLAGLFTLFSFSFLIAGFIRNHLLVGTWKGGNDKYVDNSLLDSLKSLLRIFYQLLFGSTHKATLGTVEIIILICCIGFALHAAYVFFLAHEKYACEPQYRHRKLKSLTLLLIALLVGVYAMAMVYAGMTTVITYSSRMFFPLLPLLAIAAAIAVNYALTSNKKTIPILLIAVGITCYGIINARNVIAHHPIQRHEQLELFLKPTLGDNNSLKSILTEIHPDQTIIANSSNALNYVVNRPILAIPFREYSAKAWSLDILKALAKQYNSRYLVLFKDDKQIFADYTFLVSLQRGAYPPWLQLVYTNSDVVVYEIARQ